MASPKRRKRSKKILSLSNEKSPVAFSPTGSSKIPVVVPARSPAKSKFQILNRNAPSPLAGSGGVVPRLSQQTPNQNQGDVAWSVAFNKEVVDGASVSPPTPPRRRHSSPLGSRTKSPPYTTTTTTGTREDHYHHHHYHHYQQLQEAATTTTTDVQSDTVLLHSKVKDKLYATSPYVRRSFIDFPDEWEGPLRTCNLLQWEKQLQMEMAAAGDKREDEKCPKSIKEVFEHVTQPFVIITAVAMHTNYSNAPTRNENWNKNDDEKGEEEEENMNDDETERESESKSEDESDDDDEGDGGAKSDDKKKPPANRSKETPNLLHLLQQHNQDREETFENIPLGPLHGHTTSSASSVPISHTISSDDDDSSCFAIIIPSNSSQDALVEKPPPACPKTDGNGGTAKPSSSRASSLLDRARHLTRYALTRARERSPSPKEVYESLDKAVEMGKSFVQKSTGALLAAACIVPELDSSDDSVSAHSHTGGGNIEMDEVLSFISSRKEKAPLTYHREKIREINDSGALVNEGDKSNKDDSSDDTIVISVAGDGRMEKEEEECRPSDNRKATVVSNREIDDENFTLFSDSEESGESSGRVANFQIVNSVAAAINPTTTTVAIPTTVNTADVPMNTFDAEKDKLYKRGVNTTTTTAYVEPKERVLPLDSDNKPIFRSTTTIASTNETTHDNIKRLTKDQAKDESSPELLDHSLDQRITTSSTSPSRRRKPEEDLLTKTELRFPDNIDDERNKSKSRRDLAKDTESPSEWGEQHQQEQRRGGGVAVADVMLTSSRKEETVRLSSSYIEMPPPPLSLEDNNAESYSGDGDDDQDNGGIRKTVSLVLSATNDAGDPLDNNNDLTEMMALISEEVSMKRYQSMADLTDLEPDVKTTAASGSVNNGKADQVGRQNRRCEQPKKESDYTVVLAAPSDEREHSSTLEKEEEMGEEEGIGDDGQSNVTVKFKYEGGVKSSYVAMNVPYLNYDTDEDEGSSGLSSNEEEEEKEEKEGEKEKEKNDDVDNTPNTATTISNVKKTTTTTPFTTITTPNPPNSPKMGIEKESKNVFTMVSLFETTSMLSAEDIPGIAHLPPPSPRSAPKGLDGDKGSISRHEHEEPSSDKADTSNPSNSTRSSSKNDDIAYQRMEEESSSCNDKDNVISTTTAAAAAVGNNNKRIHDEHESDDTGSSTGHGSSGGAVEVEVEGGGGAVAAISADWKRKKQTPAMSMNGYEPLLDNYHYSPSSSSGGGVLVGETRDSIIPYVIIEQEETEKMLESLPSPPDNSLLEDTEPEEEEGEGEREGEEGTSCGRSCWRSVASTSAKSCGGSKNKNKKDNTGGGMDRTEENFQTLRRALNLLGKHNKVVDINVLAKDNKKKREEEGEAERFVKGMTKEEFYETRNIQSRILATVIKDGGSGGEDQDSTGQFSGHRYIVSVKNDDNNSVKGKGKEKKMATPTTLAATSSFPVPTSLGDNNLETSKNPSVAGVVAATGNRSIDSVHVYHQLEQDTVTELESQLPLRHQQVVNPTAGVSASPPRQKTPILRLRRDSPTPRRSRVHNDAEPLEAIIKTSSALRPVLLLLRHDDDDGDDDGSSQEDSNRGHTPATAATTTTQSPRRVVAPRVIVPRPRTTGIRWKLNKEEQEAEEGGPHAHANKQSSWDSEEDEEEKEECEDDESGVFYDRCNSCASASVTVMKAPTDEISPIIDVAISIIANDDKRGGYGGGTGIEAHQTPHARDCYSYNHDTNTMVLRNTEELHQSTVAQTLSSSVVVVAEHPSCQAVCDDHSQQTQPTDSSSSSAAATSKHTTNTNTMTMRVLDWLSQNDDTSINNSSIVDTDIHRTRTSSDQQNENAMPQQNTNFSNHSLQISTRPTGKIGNVRSTTTTTTTSLDAGINYSNGVSSDSLIASPCGTRRRFCVVKGSACSPRSDRIRFHPWRQSLSWSSRLAKAEEQQHNGHHRTTKHYYEYYGHDRPSPSLINYNKIALFDQMTINEHNNSSLSMPGSELPQAQTAAVVVLSSEVPVGVLPPPSPKTTSTLPPPPPPPLAPPAPLLQLPPPLSPQPTDAAPPAAAMPSASPPRQLLPLPPTPSPTIMQTPTMVHYLPSPSPALEAPQLQQPPPPPPPPPAAVTQMIVPTSPAPPAAQPPPPPLSLPTAPPLPHPLEASTSPSFVDAAVISPIVGHLESKCVMFDHVCRTVETNIADLTCVGGYVDRAKKQLDRCDQLIARSCATLEKSARISATARNQLSLVDQLLASDRLWCKKKNKLLSRRVR